MRETIELPFTLTGKQNKSIEANAFGLVDRAGAVQLARDIARGVDVVMSERQKSGDENTFLITCCTRSEGANGQNKQDANGKFHLRTTQLAGSSFS
jgi:hypothetical protein